MSINPISGVLPAYLQNKELSSKLENVLSKLEAIQKQNKKLSDKLIVNDFALSCESQLDRFLKIKDVLHVVGLGRTTFLELVKENQFPAPFKLKNRSILLWSMRDIQQWQNDLIGGVK